jgi:hypothetical protein
MLIFIVVVLLASVSYGLHRYMCAFRKRTALMRIDGALIEGTLEVSFAECGESLLPGQGFYQGTLTGTFGGHQLIVNAYFNAAWANQPHRLIIHLDDRRLEWSVEPPKMLCGREAKVLRSLDFYACRRGLKSLLPCKMKS